LTVHKADVERTVNGGSHASDGLCTVVHGRDDVTQFLEKADAEALIDLRVSSQWGDVIWIRVMTYEIILDKQNLEWTLILMHGEGGRQWRTDLFHNEIISVALIQTFFHGIDTSKYLVDDNDAVDERQSPDRS
jgi:hypothetical protein